MEYVTPPGQQDGSGYVDGDPNNGVEGSVVLAKAIENPMREILAVIEDAGLTPDPANLNQLTQAIQELINDAEIDLVDGVNLVSDFVLKAGQRFSGPVETGNMAATYLLDLGKPMQQLTVTADTTIYPVAPLDKMLGQDLVIDNRGGHSLALGVSNLGPAMGQDMAAWNTVDNPIVSAGGPVSPNGNAAAHLVHTTNSRSESIYSGCPVDVGLKYTFSFFAKAGAAANIKWHVYGSAVQQNHVMNINLVNGQISNESLTGVMTRHDYGAIYCGDGWWWLYATLTLNGAEVGANFRVYPLDDAGNEVYAGDGASGVYVVDPMYQIGDLGPFTEPGALRFENDFSADLPTDGLTLLSLRAVAGRVWGGIVK